MFWQTLWCFYNSSAFKTAASVALLGAVAVILPALINLPSKRNPAAGALQTPINEFNSSRTHTIILGLVALVASIGPLVLYFLTFAAMGGKTCDVTVAITAHAKFLLVLLYIATVLVLGFFGWFYIVWRSTLSRENRLTDLRQ